MQKLDSMETGESSKDKTPNTQLKAYNLHDRTKASNEKIRPYNNMEKNSDLIPTENGTGDQVSTIGEGVIEKKKHDDYLYYHSSGQKPKSRPRSNSVR